MEFINKNKKWVIISGIIVFVLIVSIILFLNYMEAKNNDKYVTIKENDSYIYYKFKFDDTATGKKTYKIKDYKVMFNLSNKKPYYEFKNIKKFETMARVYDIYYLKKKKSVLVLDKTDFGMGMNLVNKKDLKNLSNYIDGSFSIENIIINDKIWKFDVLKYSDNYIVSSKDAVFSLCVNNYKNYVDDDYPIIETYEYDLSKKLSLDNFEKKVKMTIKQLSEKIKDKCDKVDNTEIKIPKDNLDKYLKGGKG